MTTYYNVFHRSWWKANSAWPDGREPGAGERHYIQKRVTLQDAHELCDQWNASHDPGQLSDKAEFEEA
jgi:hypothetical protein